MIVYHFSKKTREYIGFAEAKFDPVDGTPIVPAFTTTEKPLFPAANQAAVYINKSWQLVPDFRGRTYWHADHSYDTIKEINVSPPADATLTPPPGPDYILENGIWRTMTQAEIDQEHANEALDMMKSRIPIKDQVILKQIFKLRKLNEPALTQQQFTDELIADYIQIKQGA